MLGNHEVITTAMQRALADRWKARAELPQGATGDGQSRPQGAGGAGGHAGRHRGQRPRAQSLGATCSRQCGLTGASGCGQSQTQPSPGSMGGSCLWMVPRREQMTFLDLRSSSLKHGGRTALRTNRPEHRTLRSELRTHGQMSSARVPRPPVGRTVFLAGDSDWMRTCERAKPDPDPSLRDH